jgi:hypothetical protein
MAKVLIVFGSIIVIVLLTVLLFEMSFLSQMAKVLIIFASIFSIIGILSLTALLAEVSFLVRSKRWPVVSGTVQSSSEEEVTYTGDYTSVSAYHPAIFYRYEVDGKQYIILELRLHETNDQQLLAEYPAGMKVSVFYNPKKPKDSTLRTKYNRIQIDWYLKTIIPLAAGALLFGLAFTVA